MKATLVLMLTTCGAMGCGEGSPLEDGSCFIECKFYDSEIDRTHRAVYSCIASNQIGHEAQCHTEATETCEVKYGGDGSVFQFGWVPGCDRCDEACAPSWYKECNAALNPGCQWID